MKSGRTWIFAVILSCAFLVGIDCLRWRHVAYVSGLGAEEAVVDAASSTGYAGGLRWLIVPEHNNQSDRWVLETEQMFARREWRVRHVEEDNAPFGRETRVGSPYRWLLGGIAYLDHSISARSFPQSVEKAAVLVDPAIHLFLMLVSSLLISLSLGNRAAALFAIGLAVVFPLSGAFLPGGPDHHGMALSCAVVAVIAILAGIRSISVGSFPSGAEPARPPALSIRCARQYFLGAGIVTGLGLWISVTDMIPILVGLAIGAIAAAFLTRTSSDKILAAVQWAMLWRNWALGGAVTALFAYLIEYFPNDMDYRLEANHPLYALALIGLGEVIAWVFLWVGRGKPFTSVRDVTFLILGIVAIVALPIAVERRDFAGFYFGDLAATRLTYLPNGVVADSLMTWLKRDGFSWTLLVTALPLLVIPLALGQLLRRNVDGIHRTTMIVVLGPIFVLFGLACVRLRFWSELDGMLLILMVSLLAATAATGGPPIRRWGGVTVMIVLLLPGLVVNAVQAWNDRSDVTLLDGEGLFERDLAHWLAAHSLPNETIVLAPPFRTTSLCFYGGIRGVGTFDWENKDGLAAAIRIAASTKRQEVETLIRRRGINYIALPAWDSSLDELAGLTTARPDQGFIAALHRWAQPSWLRPIPYRCPAVAGIDEQSVLLFAVVDEQDKAAALARLVEYFVEMEQLDLASSANEGLRQYPTDLGALVASARLAMAQGDTAEFERTFAAISNSLSAGTDRILPWDRRVSLAVVLAYGKKFDPAHKQAQRCFSELDEQRLRSLTTGSLYHLLVLGKAFKLKFRDPSLHDLAIRLLPQQVRDRI
jgi:hypothetical protein